MTPMGRALWLTLFLAMAACAPLREDGTPKPSHAFDHPAETKLGQAFATAEHDHPGQSGFRLLNNGLSALMTRAALADQAERSIDFQTFIFDSDQVGAFVLDRLIAAARRGVRVRMLLDDYQLALDDGILARLNAEPNMEVRLFNPFPDRMRWSWPLQMAWETGRLGKRMHNKVLVADNQMALLGGRNISNTYFDAEAVANFRDVELLAAGPVARQASASFDAFWNSAMVVPVTALGRHGSAAEDARQLDDLLELNQDEIGPAAEYRRRAAEYARRVTAAGELTWATAHVVAEPPVRQAAGAPKSSAEIARAHAIARQAATREVVYESAYFVPGDRGVEVLGELARRGVAVSVLTNSLASTDVVAVHSSYALYRPALLKAGIRLFEYRAEAKRPEATGSTMRKNHSDSALHAKIVVYDRKLVWVGSANFDPRSRHLNTEIGVMIESETLASRVLAGIERDFAPSQSWRLELAPSGLANALIWVGEQDGREVRRDTDPDASPWRGLNALFYTVLPGIEELL